MPARLLSSTLLLLTVPGFVAAQYDAVGYGDIVVQLRPSPRPNLDQGGGHGCVEYRFAITNRSAKNTHQVRIQLPYDIQFLQLQKSTSIGPGDRVEVAVFQPVRLTLGYGGVRIFIDGQAQENLLPVPNVEARVWHGGPDVGSRMKFILAQQSLVNPLNDNVVKSAVTIDDKAQANEPNIEEFKTEFSSPEGQTRTFSYEGRHYLYNVVNSFSGYEEDLSFWSPNWLAYTCLDGVVVRGTAFDTAPERVRSALTQFAECGGTLLLVGPATSLPASWQKTAVQLDGMTGYSPGLGRCLVTKDNDIGAWQPAQWSAIVDSWYGSAAPWSTQHDMYSANSMFQVVDSFGIPVRGLFMVMLIFAILIGPVNMYLLGRTRRRIWLLWTVPLISFLTCVAVFVYMYSSEGWYGHSRTEGFTVLDERANQASSIGWTGFYSPLTPSDGLHFDYGTELAPQISDDREDWRYYGRRRNEAKHRLIDWSSDQHLRSGWVAARLPVHFKFRRSEPRLERLTVSKSGTGYMVTNGLKGRIKHLWVADEAGVIATASDVAPGREVALTRTNKKAAGDAGSLRRIFRDDWSKLASSLPRSPEQSLRPGTYIAEMEGAPFLPNGLPGARSQEASIVFGIMKEPIHAH